MNWIDDIKNYVPYNEQEKKDKELILNAISNYNNILDRECSIAHITSSGYIVNKSRTKVLMIYHKLYNSWAWTGGHADGDCDLLHVAIKEAKEETGLTNVTAVTNDILGLDVLNVNGHIKNNKYVSSHLHLSVAYLLEANEEDELIVNEEETNGVQWIPIDKLDTYCSEPYIIESVYNKFNKKIKELGL
ncbi:MAG: NUDIX hydrolase [Clostridium sp.]|nr:NUDIX hydrolase [Clostridium sp.]